MDPSREFAAEFAELAVAQKADAAAKRAADAADAVEAWRAARRPFEWSAHGHVCDCDCTMQKIAAAPLSLMFGCARTGAVHCCGSECARRVVTRESEFTCGLTGTYLSRALVDAWADAHSAVPVEVGRESNGYMGVGERRKFTPAIAKRVKSRYVRQNRPIIVAAIQKVWAGADAELAKLEAAVAEDAGAAVDAYLNECAASKTWPLAHVARQRVYAVVAASPVYERSPLTPERVEVYAQSVESLWGVLEKEIPVNKRSEAHVQTFTVAALYMLQHGIVMKGESVAPPDMWLFHNLPGVSALVHKGFKRRVVTAGRNVINAAMCRMSAGGAALV